MKKIFRMALVFALAGATLMYTGCTKDYDEDINALKQKVDTIQSDLSNKMSALEGEVSSLKSAISSLESAYKAADKALDDKISDLKTRVAALEDAIKGLDKYATKDDLNKAVADLEKKIADAKAEVLAKADELKKQVDENTKNIAEIKAALDAVYAALGDSLTSIVFFPDFYFAGIESCAYDFLNVQTFKPVMGDGKDFTIGETTYNFPKTAKIEYKEAYKLDKNGKETKDLDTYTLGQLGIAKYDLNPSTFPLDSAAWSLNGMDRRYVVRTKAEEVKTWKPIFEGISMKDGHAAVQYSIENPELLIASVDEAFGLGEEETEEAAADGTKALEYDKVPVMQLVATLKDEPEVVSDWHAITSGVDSLGHLAFAKTTDYVTEADPQCEIAKDHDLYLTAKETLEPEGSVPVKYNGGGLDLAKIVNIHMVNSEGKLVELTMAELNEKYPGFTMNFELVPYVIGDNVTSEDMYGDIKGTWFTPCYVESVGGKPRSIVIEKDSEAGISSVGRMPVVLATVTDEAGKVVLYGYFKIEITKDQQEPTSVTYDMPSFGKVPFICDPVLKKTSWHEFSYFVLETLGVDYAEFVKNYVLTGIWGYENVADGKNFKTDFVQIVEAAANEDVEVIYADPKTKEDVNYGTVSYVNDKAGTGINDAFTWEVDPQGLGEGGSKTLYFRFESGPYNIVYFAVTAEVAAAAKFDFGANKIANEWHTDIDGEELNTARVNVPVPTADKTDPVKGGDVTKFQRDLNHYYIGYKPLVKLASDADPIYAEYFDGKATPTEDIETNSTYYFASEQPVINGKQFFTNYWADSDTLYVASYDAKGKLVEQEVEIDGKKVKVPAALHENVIAYLTPDEETGATDIVYIWEEGDTVAKEFLNLWSYKETDQAKMLYGNIIVKTTYGECEIPAGDENFHVRFIRPLDIQFDAQDIAEESAVDGANVEIAKFISDITDWNNQKVIVPEKDDKGKETGYYIANVIKTVDMYKYYQFKTLRVNLGKAVRNNWNTADLAEWGIITEVTPAVKLALGTVDEDGVFTALEAQTDEDGNTYYELDIEDFENIKGAVINYRNDEAYVRTFTIKVPVEIGYAWGTYADNFTINIKETGNTEDGTGK